MWRVEASPVAALRGANERATRIALVEDHAVFADALRVCLEMEGFETVPLVPAQFGGGGGELLSSAIQTRARVVLLDLDLGAAGDGSGLVRPLVVAGHRVVVLTASRDRVRWGACLARGAVTVVSKVAPLLVIVEVLHRVDKGVAVLDPRERDSLVRLWREHDTRDDRSGRLARLTPREAYVLGELARGRRVREVAEEAFVSEATVRTHVKAILAKLGVTSQLAAVAIVRDLGWTPPVEGPSLPASAAAAADRRSTSSGWCAGKSRGRT